MNLALRILGVAIFISAIAGATFGAFQIVDRDASFTAVELSAPGQTPTLLAGGSTQVAIGVQNVGDTSENITLKSGTDGFTFKPLRSPLAVAANSTSNARGTLSVDTGITGTRSVTIQAFSHGTDRKLGSVSFDVKIVEAKDVELTLEPNLPAALPGENFTLQGQATNPVEANQQLNFSLSGAQGTVEPASARLQPNGTSAVTVTVEVPEDASGSVTPTLEAVNEAGDTSTASAEVPVLAPGEIAVEAVFDDIAVQPGNRYAVPILVVSNLASQADVSASGSDVVATNFTSVGPGEATGGFATLRVPSAASDTQTETITVTVGDATREVTVTVNPSAEGEMAEEGKQVSVDYVGRLVDGTVFDASVPEVAHGPFPKSESFRGRQGLQPIDLTLNPNRPGVIPGFFDALLDMTKGESKSVVLEPTEAYGPVRNHQNLSATTSIERENSVPRLLEDIPKQQLPPAFDIENKTVGDVITYKTSAGEETITFRFELTKKGDRTVTLKRLADVGDTTTFYAPWPNATEVVDVNETAILYETTPPEDAGNFTWDVNQGSHQAAWENATTVASVNATHIELLHQPEEGLEYQAASGPRAPPQTYLVEAVGPEEIHVSTPNNHPLAGKTLIFDLTLRDVSDPPQRRGQIPIGGGR